MTDASPNPVLYLDGLRAPFRLTAHRHLVLREEHTSVDDADTCVPGMGDVDASKIAFRVFDVVGGAFYERSSASGSWEEMRPAPNTNYHTFTLADLRGGLVSLSGASDVSELRFEIQAVDDRGHLSDSDSSIDGAQAADVGIEVVALKSLEAGGDAAINDDGALDTPPGDGALTPDDATSNAWIGGAAGGLTILVELHHALSGEELFFGNHGISTGKVVVSSWDSSKRRISLEGSSTATSLDFQSILNVLHLRSVVSSSDGYRRVQVRPDVSGDVSRKYFYVRDVRVYTNDAPISGGLPALSAREGVSTEFQVAAFTDEEDDAVGKDLTYGAQLVVGGTLGALPPWIDFVEDDADFYVFPRAGLDSGVYTLRVSAQDGSTTTGDFTLTVLVVVPNDAPVASSLADPDPVLEDTSFTYVFSRFTDKEDDAASKDLTYEAKLVVGGSEQDIPGDWIEFGAVDGDTTKLQFTFTPKDSSHVGSHTLRVRGTDSGGLWAEAEFEVEVTAVNDAPKKPAAGLADPDDVLEDTSPTYVVSAFTDEEDDAANKGLTYVAQLVVGGTPGALPKWIEFDEARRTFTFKPRESSHAGRYKVRVRGRDSGGLSDLWTSCSRLRK